MGDRTAHVYCGLNTTYRGMFEEPDECSWEGNVALPECLEDDFAATFDCPACGARNLVSDHAVSEGGAA